MTNERVAELMKEPETQEMIRLSLNNYMDQQKIQRVKTFRKLNPTVKKGQIVFVGSSLMEHFPIGEMQLKLELDKCIYNRGIGGTTTDNLLSTMEECIFQLEPSEIFINIGSNDIGNMGYDKTMLIENYNQIMNQIQERLPICEVYVMAFYPVNPKADFGLPKHVKEMVFATRTNENIAEANSAVEQLAKEHGFQFINVNEGLSDHEGNLKEEFSVEGLHMWPDAYEIILDNLKRFL
jgi:lysophospholipase L1-like esterase